METGQKHTKMQGAFLPSRTWNFLHVNQADFMLPDITSQECSEKMPANKMERVASIKGSFGAEFYKWLDQSDRETVALTFRKNETKQLNFMVRSGQHRVSRLFILVKAGCHAKVVTEITSANRGSAGFYQSVQILLEEGATLTYEQVQMLGSKYHFYSDIACEEERNAKLTVTRVNFGAGETKIGLEVFLKGERSEAASSLCYTGNKSQTLEIDDIIRHQAKKTISRLNTQGVLNGAAVKNYKGTIDFVHGCAGSKGTELENVLLLSDDVINKTVPLILCGEEDVDGNHGATIGEVDEELLNYLKARGFDQTQAKLLIIEGKFSETLLKISDKGLQRKAESYLREVMKDEQ